MFSGVCRRGSSGGGGTAGSAGNMVRRTASMVVPVSAMEQVMLSGGLYNDQSAGDAVGWADRSQQAGVTGGTVTARPTSILDAGIMSRSCSALPSSTHADSLLDEDGLLLPPSPFRSPDFDEDEDTDSSCLDGMLASCGYGAPPSLPPPPPPDHQVSTTTAPPHHATNGHHPRDRHLAILSDLGRPAASADNFVWTSLPSPDDVTPTNENQPHGFIVNRHPAGCTGSMPAPPPAPPPPLASDKCLPVRHSDL